MRTAQHPDESQHRIDLAVDRDGNRYTTHAFGFDGDPWQGATILTAKVVERLRCDGLLPLTEVARSFKDGTRAVAIKHRYNLARSYGAEGRRLHD